MGATHRWFLRGGMVLLLGGLGIGLLTGRAGAQVPITDAIEIVALQHDPRGSLSVALRLPRQATLEDPVLILDDIPRAIIPRTRDARRPAGILLAIDTSGSMAGAPMEAARRAARDLIAQLPAEDEVALIRISSTAEVVLPLSPDRGPLLAALDRLAAGGATALYGAMALAATELERIPATHDRVLVLLSDGADDGGVSRVDRAESLRLVQATGAKAYVTGFGDEIDRSYLEQLAAATGGSFSLFGERQADALAARFAEIGGVLGAAELLRVDVPLLAAGEHVITVRGRVNGRAVSATRSLHVTNDGLLAPAVMPPEGEAGPITVALNSLVPAEDLSLVAEIEGVALPVDLAGGTVAVDPWGISAGQRTLRLSAYAGRDLASTVSVAIEIPPLRPRLDVVEHDRGQVSATGKIQGEPSPVIVALLAGREIARGEGAVSVAGGQMEGPVTFRLLDGSGSVVAETTTGIAPSRTTGRPLGSILAAGLLGGGVMAWVLRRLRNRLASRAGEVGARALPRSRPRVGGQVVRSTEVALVGPAGTEGVYRLHDRPLTIGSSAGCDILLGGEEDGEGVLARLTVLPGDRGVLVHHLRARFAGRYGRRPADEWTVLQPGEAVSIGSHLLRLPGLRDA